MTAQSLTFVLSSVDKLCTLDSLTLDLTLDVTLDPTLKPALDWSRDRTLLSLDPSLLLGHLLLGHPLQRPARLPELLDIILIHFAVLDKQYVQRMLDHRRHARVQMLVRFVAPKRLGDPSECERNLPHMGVHGKVGTLESKHEDAARGLGTDAFESKHLRFGLLIREVMQILESAFAALCNERLQNRLNARSLDVGEAARADGGGNIRWRCEAHLFPRWEPFLERREGAVRVDVRRVLIEEDPVGYGEKMQIVSCVKISWGCEL